MARHKRAVEGLPTSWRAPDQPWARVAPSLEAADPPSLRIDPRAALDASVYRLRSGVQWTRLPEEVPDARSVHRTLRRGVRPGVLDRGCGVLVADGTELPRSADTYVLLYAPATLARSLLVPSMTSIPPERSPRRTGR